jgi:hypothetical protein
MDEEKTCDSLEQEEDHKDHKKAQAGRGQAAKWEVPSKLGQTEPTPMTELEMFRGEPRTPLRFPRIPLVDKKEWIYGKVAGIPQALFRGS